MVSGRLIKLVVFELLEFAAFSVPTLVIMEQFATAYHSKRNASEKTHYWLIVSCSIAYVASVTLLIWVPVKVLLHKKHHLHKKIKGWRPVMMMCVVLTTLPSFSFSIAVAEVQKNINGTDDNSPDPLPDLSVSLVLTCLIVVDIIEKIRVYPLRGSQKSSEDSRIHETTLRQITTVTEQVRRSEENPSASQAARRPELSRSGEATTQIQALAPGTPEEPSFHSGVLKAMSRRDVRAEIFLWSFLLWSDTIEMVRVAGHPSVYNSGWVYPVYIFSFISLLRLILTPRNPLLNSLGMLLQDLPFIFVRLSLIIVLGTITPVLGLCKNILVMLSYVYFNYLIKLRVFSTFEIS
ncbi:PREDICTED: transmembrane protein 236 [Elephantulus edwardii]|uniref:transmembrane protein 236 n=1 Tax=Elephantulus edwardii TaxID=28737 RepID=UPI0003F0DA3E|nr:PREDICTED: transmembrane protein 236 [Elephantulus edwardii]